MQEGRINRINWLNWLEMFKKRSVKGNIRSTEVVKGTESDEDEKDVDLSALQSTKLDQTLRKKKAGLDAANVMNKSVRSTAGDSGDNQQVADISIGANMKSQFSSKMLGTGAAISHENIMEQYVEEALGLRNRADSDVDKGPKTVEEQLILEAKTKYSGGGLLETDSEAIEAGLDDDDKNGKKEETDVDTSVFTGIAEVELPSSYKLKTMKETEKSLLALMERKKVREEERNSHHSSGKEFRINTIQKNIALTDVSSGYGGRFTKPKSRADYEAEERRRNMTSVSGGGVPTVPLPPDLSKATGANDEDADTPATSTSAAGGRNTSNRQPGTKGNRSNDTRMLENYKKRLKY